MEEPGGLQSMGSLRVGHGWATSLSLFNFHFPLSCIGEGNGIPLHCSCLENPRDAGAWWAPVYGIAQSRTQLKWLSCRSSLLLRTSLFAACWDYSVIAVHWLFKPVFRLMQIIGSRALRLSSCDPLVLLPRGIWNLPKPGLKRVS